MDQLFAGQIVHCKAFDDFEIFTDGFLAVRAGKIIKVGQRSELKQWKAETPDFTAPINQLSATQFLIPGFIDCHIHAPQMPNIGLGLDMELLDWLQEYTFPMESQYKDTEYAKHVYEKVVKRTLASGTTLATYFATNHKDSSIILAKEAIQQGQRAFIGKVSSNCGCPDYYMETTSESLQANQEFIKEMLALKTELVLPIITPRFALSCDMPLMKELGKLAKDEDLHIQSHISENLGEIEAVKNTYKMKYAEVYDAAGLLTNKCILAHGVHLEDAELRLFAERNTSLAHCPTSNTNLRSGLCDVKRARSFGVRVGLGTDVSGGSQSSILCTIKDALDVSHHLNFVKKQLIQGAGRIAETSENNAYVPLTYKQVIFLATLGGAEALSVDQVVGNFVVGKDFDALLVDVAAGSIDQYWETDLSRSKSGEKRLLELVQKFVYAGDDRNIYKVFVSGRQVKV